MKGEIYFDHSATTPPLNAALAAFTETARDCYGNPSSLHGKGQQAKALLLSSGKTLLSSLGASDGQVVFTASGTEANNLALFGRLEAKERYRGGTVLVTEGEHPSVSSPAAALARAGVRVETIPTSGGALDLERLSSLLSERVFLVSTMLVNNETGAFYDLAPVKRLMRERAPHAALHTDATQAFFHVPFSAKTLGADLITVSAHKIGGVRGVGALWISSAVLKERGIAPVTLGGGQEEGLRSGTENLPGIAAFAAACKERKENFTKDREKLHTLYECLKHGLSAIPEVRPLLPARFSPHVMTLILPRIKSQVMVNYLSREGIYVSAGSACSSHGKGVSPALLAFGVSEREADTAIRVSFSPENELAEVERFLSVLASGVSSLSRMR